MNKRPREFQGLIGAFLALVNKNDPSQNPLHGFDVIKIEKNPDGTTSEWCLARIEIYDDGHRLRSIRYSYPRWNRPPEGRNGWMSTLIPFEDGGPLLDMIAEGILRQIQNARFSKRARVIFREISAQT